MRTFRRLLALVVFVAALVLGWRFADANLEPVSVHYLLGAIDGVPLWAANGIPLCTAAGDRLSLQMVADGAGGAILTWQDFRNGTDWKLREDGTWRHVLGPKVKRVQIDLQVYYAGLAAENREPEEGDLVLIAKPNFNQSWNSSVSGTVFVNGRKTVVLR